MSARVVVAAAAMLSLSGCSMYGVDCKAVDADIDRQYEAIRRCSVTDGCEVPFSAMRKLVADEQFAAICETGR